MSQTWPGQEVTQTAPQAPAAAPPQSSGLPQLRTILDIPPDPQEQQLKKLQILKAQQDIQQGGNTPEPLGAGDPAAHELLGQTGLSVPAFYVLTGQSGSLPRDAVTRNIAFKQAEQFAKTHGVDISSLGDQYQAYNQTLRSNIMRNNQTNILEQEIAGTIDVLKPIADQAGMGGLNIANVAKLFAGKQFNDPTVQKYRQQLLILQSELAGMNAAARGNIDQSGNVKTDQGDMADAAQVITNGLNSGGAEGLKQAVQDTTTKNRTVLQANIDATRKAIWGLFGVGDNYKPLYASAADATGQNSQQQQNGSPGVGVPGSGTGGGNPGGDGGAPLILNGQQVYDASRNPVGVNYGGEIFDAQGNSLGLYGEVSDTSPTTYDKQVAAEAARQDNLRGQAGLTDLAAHGLTMGLTDEASGVGQAVGRALHGDFNIGQNYDIGRDAEELRLKRARERLGLAGDAAEFAGNVATGGVGAGAEMTAGEAARNAAVIGSGIGFGYGRGAEGSLTGAAVGGVTGAALGAAGQKAGDYLASRTASKVANASEAAPAVEAGAEGAAAPLAANDQTEIADLAKKATSWGPTARAARQTLAKKAAANPEAKAAADRLGVDIPPDILSDDAQVQSLAGLTRSQVGSDAETGWRATSARVSQQADQAMQDIGGNSDLAQVSDDTFHRLNSTAQSLERQASALREDVNAQINPATRVDATNLQEVVAGLINDYGGLAEAKAAMTPQERSLLTMLGEGETAIQPTYARLDRLRNDIGEALSKNQGPWADVSRAQLSKYYKALADDQMAAVEQMGGPELADTQRAANTLFSQMYDQRGQMQDLFGKNLEGSLAPILRRSITGATKGDAKGITQLLNRIPEDARGGAIVSAIMAQSRSSAAHGGFSFANYSKLYRGLRQNGPIFAQIAKAVGPQGTRVLTDLYTISSRMAVAETNVLKTGKANQVLSNAVQSEGLLGNVMYAAGHRVVAGAGAAVGGTVAGPAGAVAGAALATGTKDALMTAGASRLDKVHTLLSSPTFKAAVAKLANDGDSAAAEDAIWRDTAFHRFAKSLGYVTTTAKRAFLKSLIPGAARITSEVAGDAFSGPTKLAAQPNNGTSTTGGAQP